MKSGPGQGDMLDKPGGGVQGPRAGHQQSGDELSRHNTGVSGQRPGGTFVAVVPLQTAAHVGKFASQQLGSKNPERRRFKNQNCFGPEEVYAVYMVC